MAFIAADTFNIPLEDSVSQALPGASPGVEIPTSQASPVAEVAVAQVSPGIEVAVSRASRGDDTLHFEVTEPNGKSPKQAAFYPSTNAINIYQPSSNKFTAEGISTPRQGSCFLVSLKVIIHVPKTSLSKRKMTVHRNRGKTAILTGSPYKNELLALNTKLLKSKIKGRKRLAFPPAPK
ncbi:hypothetical protein PR048_011432 [Dryococelus australis]|uniref:Uncharacterized protein n=1 Tax=Dryococelus australis TaxID=614101 RepID=A0ABQ9HLK1_9NEOP|nr:hypothetical protein PR048_011432 [Dryococelus australis]